MDIKELAEQVGQTGHVADPELVKVDIQVRTGMMFPLPSWIEPADPARADHRSPKDRQ